MMIKKTCWEEEELLLTSKQTNYILFSHVFNACEMNQRQKFLNGVSEAC